MSQNYCLINQEKVDIPKIPKKYKVTKLVYHEETSDVGAAISREKQLKTWRRSKKVALIESVNPLWEDMALRWYARLP